MVLYAELLFSVLCFYLNGNVQKSQENEIVGNHLKWEGFSVLQETILFVFLCIMNVFAQSFIYNSYERFFIDERDGKSYQFFEADSSKWFVEDLRYIPESTFGSNTLDGELYCESTFKSKQTAADVFSKKSIENCRKVYYKWDLAMKSCPQGWHLAKTQEWVELSDFLKKNPFMQKVFFSRRS